MLCAQDLKHQYKNCIIRKKNHSLLYVFIQHEAQHLHQHIDISINVKYYQVRYGNSKTKMT